MSQFKRPVTRFVFATGFLTAPSRRRQLFGPSEHTGAYKRDTAVVHSLVQSPEFRLTKMYLFMLRGLPNL